MDRICNTNENIEYECHPFHGIGGFPHKNTVSEIKTGKLLQDLGIYLKGFDKKLQGISATIFVVVDNDDREKEQFHTQLEKIASEQSISTDHVFCIAIEEMEAWLLGDRQALKAAYPRAKDNILKAYVQDSICGTWECLADAVYKGGCKALRKCPYNVIGKAKAEWAENIGKFMVPERNASPSFQYFYHEIIRRVQNCES